MKVLLIILDGIADRLVEKLDYRTPLETGNTPNLDILSSSGLNGIMYPISPGIAPSTELAHLRILGYPEEAYPGRAYIESLGNNLNINDDDAIIKTSLASVSKEDNLFNIISRKPLCDSEECVAFSQVIRDLLKHDIEYIPSINTDGFLILKSKFSSEITDADPFENNLPVIKVTHLSSAKDLKKAKKTADLVNSIMLDTFKSLSSHPLNKVRENNNLPPINFMLTKWAGSKKRVSSFFEKYSLRGAVIASGILFKGISKYLNVDFFNIETNASPEADFLSRLKKAETLFINKKYNFVLLHTKFPDEASHKKNPELKKDVIEQIDKAFKYLLDQKFILDDESLLIITADHATPCEGPLIHSGEGVPFLLIHKKAGKDRVKNFNENSMREGHLGTLRGKDIMPLILNYTDKIRYIGSRNFPFEYLAKADSERIDPLRPE